MTVEQLIEQLQNVEDKSVKVFVRVEEEDEGYLITSLANTVNEIQPVLGKNGHLIISE